MICSKCQSWMLQHPELKFRYEGWLKCPTCGFCCLELKLVKAGSFSIET